MISFQLRELTKEKLDLEKDRTILIEQYKATKNELSAQGHCLKLRVYDCEIATCSAKILWNQHLLTELKAVAAKYGKSAQQNKFENSTSYVDLK
jgi:hypothetical protein